LFWKAVASAGAEMTSSLGKSPGKSAESGKHLGAVSGKHDPSMSSDGEGLGRSSGGRSTGTPLHDTASVHELMSRYQELQKLYEDKAAEHEKLHTKVKKQKESYIRREVKYKSEISHIKDTLEKTVLCRGAEEVHFLFVPTPEPQTQRLWIMFAHCLSQGLSSR